MWHVSWYDTSFDKFNLILFQSSAGSARSSGGCSMVLGFFWASFGAPDNMLPALAFKRWRHISRLGVTIISLLLGRQTFLQVRQHICRQLQPKLHILHSPQALGLCMASDASWLRLEKCHNMNLKLCSKQSHMYFCSHGAWNPSTGPSMPIKHGSWSSIELATRSACSALAFVGFDGFHISPFFSAASFKYAWTNWSRFAFRAAMMDSKLDWSSMCGSFLDLSSNPRLLKAMVAARSHLLKRKYVTSSCCFVLHCHDLPKGDVSITTWAIFHTLGCSTASAGSWISWS